MISFVHHKGLIYNNIIDSGRQIMVLSDEELMSLKKILDSHFSDPPSNYSKFK